MADLADPPPFGARVRAGGVFFRVWAPKARLVEVEVATDAGHEYRSLAPEGGGVHAGFVPGLGAGTLYRYRLDGKGSYPDPWSRSQPRGVHGPSEVVDPGSFRWTDKDWRGIERRALILYEVHVGTFTPVGTFDAMREELGELCRLGITALELMPVAEFPGRRNWGYDGVCLFAPSHVYGGVAGLKRLVDDAHRRGLAVLLDVVYNHLGPDGNYLRQFSDDYFSDRYRTPWGDAINYDGPNSSRVRELVVRNACYWLTEYHLDGLRLDATHTMFDQSPTHVLAELAMAARTAVGGARVIHLIAEDERRDVRLIRHVTDGGYGLDSVWADDFHHAVHVLTTGERDGYYAHYQGRAAEIARALRDGFLLRGQHARDRRTPRGSAVGAEPASAFTFCIQNHDQVGNRAFGERLHHLVGLDAYLVASVLLLLAPETPLLFMGQEFAASSPFLYFTDHHPELGRQVSGGRRQQFSSFRADAAPGWRDRLPDPQSEETFRRSRLDLAERQRHAGVYELYQRLLRLRRLDPVFSQPDLAQTDAVAIGQRCVVMRRWNERGRRLVIANFGPACVLSPRRLWPGGGRLTMSWQVVLATRAPGDGPAGVSASLGRADPSRLTVPDRAALVLADTV